MAERPDDHNFYDITKDVANDISHTDMNLAVDEMFIVKKSSQLGAEILDEVIQRGTINLADVMIRFMKVSNSSVGYFFEVQNVEDFVCRFSSDSTKYVKDNVYSLTTIPETHFDVFIKDAVVASIHLDKGATSLLSHLHNHLALALHHSRLQTSYQDLIITVSNSIITNLTDMWRQIKAGEGVKPNSEEEQVRLETVLRDIGMSLNSLRDVREFATLLTGHANADEEEVKILDLINESLQAVRPRDISIVRSELPEYMIIDKKRLQRSILVPFLMAYPRDIQCRLRIDTEVKSLASGLLYFHIMAPVPYAIRQVAISRYVDPQYLGLFLAKKLCESHDGFINVQSDTQFTFTIRFQYTSRDNILKGKRIIMFISDKKMRDQMYTILNTLTAVVSVFNEDDAELLLNNISSYDLALMEDEFALRFLKRVQRNSVPVIGITHNTVLPYNATITGQSEREIIDAYKKVIP